MSRPVSLEVKSVLAFGNGGSPDASLDGFVPDDAEHFGFHAQVFIGEVESELVDSFDLTVCSPSWLAASVESGEWELFRSGGLTVLPESVAVGTGIWFMRRWDREDFEAALRATCQGFSPGPDWGTVAARIGRLIPWEFDYLYDAHLNDHFGSPFPPDR